MDKIAGVYTSFVNDCGKIFGLNFHKQRLKNDIRTFGHHFHENDFTKLIETLDSSKKSYVRINYFFDSNKFELLQRNSPPSINKIINSQTKIGIRQNPTNKWFSIYPNNSTSKDELLINNGFVLESSSWSIVVLKDGKLFSPSENVLRSTTIAYHNEICSIDDEIIFSNITLKDLFLADGIFAANASHGFRPIASIDGVKFDSVDILNKLNFLQIQ